MIYLIAGASHTGKTLLAANLIKKYGYSCLSLDLLKMGLIRSGETELTPDDDEQLTQYLWRIVSEMIKTAIENEQNLIIEGCYIPFDWRSSFEPQYLKSIRYCCLIMSEKYITENFDSILQHESVIEKRLYDGDIEPDGLINDNSKNLDGCIKFGLDYVLIDGGYSPDEVLKRAVNKLKKENGNEAKGRIYAD